nr:MAG TPA: hypothetical protein [Caudoviricetes sp.]
MTIAPNIKMIEHASLVYARCRTRSFPLSLANWSAGIDADVSGHIGECLLHQKHRSTTYQPYTGLSVAAPIPSFSWRSRSNLEGYHASMFR